MDHSYTQNRIYSSLFLVAILAVTTLSTGCSSMTSLMGKPLPDSQKAAYGSFTVETQSSFGSPKQYQGTLNGSKTISQALAEANAIKKFQTPEVEVLRVVEKDGKSRGLRMPIEFDSRVGGPKPEQDYALLDGDRIIVKPKQGNGVVRMLGAAMGNK